MLLAVFMAAATAQTPAAAAPEAPLKEIAVAASAFVRGAPLPSWADVLPIPPAAATRRSVAIRLDDTHLLVGPKPVVLLDVAQQVNDPSALGQIGQVSMYFIPQYQKLVLHRVEILRGEQVIDHTMRAQVRFLQREDGLEQGIYSGVITASLLLGDVRVGDTLHLQYSIEGANPIFGGRYAQGVPWQRPVPVQVRRVTLNAPVGRTIAWKWNGDGPLPTVAPQTTVRDGMRRVRFEEHDLAAVEPEPMMPRGSAPLAWLQFSEWADWADVARWADGLFPDDEPLPAELVTLVQRWLRLPTRSEQASQALQWVQNEIRYYSVSLGESSHRPHPPAEVLRNRYGDCKDKTFLLMRLLQSLGIPARAVLASLSAPQGPGKGLASPLAFDHAVVRTTIDGHEYFLDPTRMGQRGPVDRMGQGLEEASVLVVGAPPSRPEPGTEPGAERAPLTVVRSANRRELFRNDLTEKFRLDAFGEDGQLETRQQFTGVPAELLRLTVARFDPPRLERLLVSNLERRYPGITVTGSPELTDEVDQNRITIHATFKVPKLATLDLDSGGGTSASGSAGSGKWVIRFAPTNMQNTLALPPSGTRRFALPVPAFPTRISYDVEAQWPQGVNALVDPVTQRIADAGFNAEVTRSFRGNVSKETLRFEPLAPTIAAKDVPALLADARTLERAIGGLMVVTSDQIGGGGVFGIGRKSLQETLRTRAQATLERSGKAIDGGQLAGDDLAQALCLRSQAQAELGRTADALKDAQEAVRQAPALGAALMCRGNANWSRGDFAAASNDFGQALALGASAADGYYRRGQSRFFEGKLEQAADDFTKAVANRSEPADKAYAQLWQAWTLQRLARPLPNELLAQAAAGDAWPQPAIALFTGRSTPEQLIEQIGRKTGDEQALALAEGWYYIGEFQLGAKQPEKAREAFEKARAPGITHYIEHSAAGFELQRLGARP